METRERTGRRLEPRLEPRRERRRFGGGSSGNERLTALVAALLLVLLAVEGATIPFLGSLLTVHIFVGMLLLGPVALKLASTGYRVIRYYGHAADYVQKGPPVTVMRLFVAPVLILSTLTLFGTGVGLLVVGPGEGPFLGLHKASFIVWVGAMAIHVLARLGRMASLALARRGGRHVHGASIRLALVGVAVAAGVVLAMLTLPLAGPWSHWAH
jgi:hypothetical protein